MTTLALTVALLLSLGLSAWVFSRWWRQRRFLRELAPSVAALADGRGEDAELFAPGDPELDEVVAGLQRLARRGAASHRSPTAMLATADWKALEAWLDAQPEITLVHRETVLYANTAAAALLGVSAQDVRGRPVLELIRPAYRAASRKRLNEWLQGRAPEERVEVQLVNGEEQGLWVELATSPVRYDGQDALLTIARDISFRKSLEASLARGRLQARMTLDSIGDGVVTTDTAGQVDYVNAAAEELVGVPRNQMLGRALTDAVALVDEVDRKALGDPVQACLQERRRVNLGRRAVMVSRSGDRECSVELTASPIRAPDGQLAGCVVLLHDVTELRGLTRQMSYQASHDALTGLLNRHEFERRLEDALAAARAEVTGHVLCYLDLDRFKVVNDTCGHVAGDNMLRELAALIREQVRDSDSVARLGGDEFGMLLVGCPLEKAQQICDDACQAVAAHRFVWQDRIFTVGVSVGLVEIGRDSGSLEDVLSAADSACYIAKQQGRGRVHVYSARDEALARQRGEIQWLQQIQSALKEERLELYTQSIVSLTGRVVQGPAIEVFLRLKDESGALISPLHFMASAERYHLMSHLDRWVVQTTLAALASGGLKVPDQRSCSINLSGQTMGDEGFLEFVVDCLDRTGVRPGQLCFEVNEAVVTGNMDHARRFINVLHGMGCRFALDNFGSGMGSFANLKSLSLDYLKIDAGFTRDLAFDTVHQAMVGAIMELSRTLDFKVVAEQVEEQAAFEAVRRMGIDFAQGYLVERPHPLRVA